MYKNRSDERAYQRAWYARNKERKITDPRRKTWVRKSLLRKWGITEEDYQKRLGKQNGGCAICKRPPSRRRLNIDHDHRTGKHRGLLCDPCNMGLGLWKDDTTRFRAAAAYIENYQ